MRWHTRRTECARLGLRCTGLGIDVLDKGTDAAVAAMASAVSALRQFRDDIAPIGGWTNDPQAHVNTYNWMLQRIDNVTNPGTLQPSPLCTVNRIISDGWQATQAIRAKQLLVENLGQTAETHPGTPERSACYATASK